MALLNDADYVLDERISSGDVDSGLAKLQELYGTDHLKGLSDRELYSLYKQHAI